jgi:hypothetical protein
MPRDLRPGIVAVALLVVACAAPGPTETPLASSTPEPIAVPEPAGPRCAGWINEQGVDPTSPEQVQNAIRFRQEHALPFGLPFVLEMACRRDANTDFSVPLSQAELQLFERRQRTTRAVQSIVEGHAARHPDEFGGMSVDHSRGGLVIVLWTGHLAEHEAALRAKLAPDAAIEFRQVRWSEKELRAVQGQVVRNDEAWFEGIEARPQSVGVDTIENVVVIGISSANPDAPVLIVAHYGMPEGMIRVESDGTGAAFLPPGTVKGVVVRRDGEPLGDVGNLMVEQAPGGPPGSCGVGDMGFTVRQDGTFEYPCQVGVRSIQILDIGGPPPNDVLGQAQVEIPAGGVGFVQIEIEAPWQP